MPVQPIVFPQWGTIIVVIIGVVMDSCRFVDQGNCCWHRRGMVVGSTKAAQQISESHKKNTHHLDPRSPII